MTAIVISDKQVVRDPMFQEIAVTAEKWVPILEVKENDLDNFLREKKTEGWSLIGVEQTANSKQSILSCSESQGQNLIEFHFPEKCVLLLGKEKEGIDAHYIYMLDTCVHIPQLGIIRYVSEMSTLLRKKFC